MPHRPPPQPPPWWRRYRIPLALFPLLLALNLAFWLEIVPGLFTNAAQTRQRVLAAHAQRINEALVACREDTGGVPAVDLELLRHPSAQPSELTPGADARRWRGPYLPTAQPFPANPYRPREGARGWQYSTRGSEGVLAPKR